jgi:hypothetical protein
MHTIIETKIRGEVKFSEIQDQGMEEIRRVTGHDRDRHLKRPLNASLRGSLCPGSGFAVVSREAGSDAATTESSV